MKKKILKTLIFVFYITLTTQLIAQGNKILPNIASLYNPSLTTLHPDYKVYHKTDSISTIYSYIYLPELNFVKLYNNTYEGKLKIKYMFYKSIEEKNILDSSSKVIKFQKTNIRESVITYFNVKIPSPDCFLVLVTKDLYNSKKSINIIHINKTETSEQNFLLLDAETLTPVFENYFYTDKEYKIKYNQEIDSILVERFYPDTIHISSPFSGQNTSYISRLDTQFYINSFANFSVKQAGIYKFSNPENDANFSSVCFNDEYPKITTPDDMLLPLKYLCTTKEYRDYEATINKKIAVDDFWLSTNNDPTVAKSLIKIYYNRVLYSNLKFTSTREGWKTDRGMIYILFGPPDILHKGDDFEQWIYVDRFSSQRLEFVFDKETTDILAENYVLRKNTANGAQWKNAVDSWKHGNLYIF